MSKIVAIVGRPNVGKSTLFNRIIGQRQAIVDDTSGVTRDRHYGVADWNGKDFIVIDTGGYVTKSEDFFEKAIRRQVDIAIEEADLLLFMVDVTVGITQEDEAFATVLRKSSKPVLVVSNKTDNFDRINDMHEFYRFGFDDIFPVSSISGQGSGDLLDKMISLLYPEHENVRTSKVKDDYPEEGAPTEEEQKNSSLPKFTIIGRPNVGKSTLLNALIGEERNIVSDTPGTTRDAVHTHYNMFGKEFLLIDTAGIRKKGKVSEDIEFYSVMRAIRALEEADVCFIVIDAQEGMESQDQKIFQLAHARKKGIIILLNKWDLVEKDTKTAELYKTVIQKKIAPFTDVPILTISALDKQRIHKALDVAMEVHANRKRRVPTHKLNEAMQDSLAHQGPPMVKDKVVRIKYVTQLPTPTPTFAFFCNHPQYIRDPYKRYLENQIRKKFEFNGVPITLVFRKK
ncbi:MAG: ribosome biogenesis GTPase Der [Bacteroidota bacterium]|nr:ribosome biogenesis GTPase Der [Bacteroidota bacterium]